MWYDALAALLAEIKTCMGGQECSYNLFVSRGIPPADCNSIAGFVEQSRPESTEFDDCNNRYNDSLVISITRCCLDPDTQDSFDPALEDREAKCFYDDARLLLECVHCNAGTALGPYIAGCQPLISGMEFDMEALGGCYTALIRIAIAEDVCC